VFYWGCKSDGAGAQLGFCDVDKAILALNSLLLHLRTGIGHRYSRNNTSRGRRSYWEDVTISADPTVISLCRLFYLGEKI